MRLIPNKKLFYVFLPSFLLLLPIISSAQKAERIKAKPALEIIYYANINGNIENCQCGEPPLGGLDRIFTIIKKQRALNPQVMLIDGGDTFNPYSFVELNRAMVKAYQIIKPDIWALSEQELVEGEDFLVKALKKQNSVIVSSNFRINNISSQKYQSYIIGKNKSARIYNYVQPVLFSKSESVHFANPEILFNELDERAYNILVFHGEEEALVKLQSKLKGFDLILTAHQQAKEVRLNSRPAIIGAGTDGENIMHISLHKSKDKITISAEQIPIGLKIEPDSEIQKLILEYKNNLQN